MKVKVEQTRNDDIKLMWREINGHRIPSIENLPKIVTARWCRYSVVMNASLSEKILRFIFIM